MSELSKRFFHSLTALYLKHFFHKEAVPKSRFLEVPPPQFYCIFSKYILISFSVLNISFWILVYGGRLDHFSQKVEILSPQFTLLLPNFQILIPNFKSVFKMLKFQKILKFEDLKIFKGCDKSPLHSNYLQNISITFKIILKFQPKNEEILKFLILWNLQKSLF